MSDPSREPPRPPVAAPTVLALHGIGKQFGGVRALRGVDLELRAGQVHALVGENGAGKSTLINIATGLFPPSEGKIEFAGREIRLSDPRHAAETGIVAVHQEADLFAELSLAENMLLGRGLARRVGGLIDWPATWAQARRELEAMDETADVRDPASSLSVGRRVIAEIAAAVARDCRVLFLDEPTASLTHAETQRLFAQIRRLRDAGVAIVYVSHRLEEILQICDVVTVLRDGERVATRHIGELDLDTIVALMVGRESGSTFSRNHGVREQVGFEARGVSDPGGRFADVSLQVRRGEIVGLYGLVGAGRSEFAQAAFGLAAREGEVLVDGRALAPGEPARAMAQGLAYLPEDRLTEGIFATHSCRGNVTAAWLAGPRRGLDRLGWISSRRERESANRVIGQLRVKLSTPEQPITTLSGGNQQKLVLGRWLETEPEVLLLDEPTRGVDIGAKVEIHRLIDELAARGKAILLISSELPEAMAMSDRVLVMAEGRLAGEFDPHEASEDEVVAAAIPRGGDKTGAAQGGGGGAWSRFRELGIVVALGLIVGLMCLVKPDEFATFKNLIDVLTAGAIVSIAAAGMTLVIVAGGIDISIGSMLGLVAAVAGLAAQAGAPPWLCLALAMGLGALLGGVNSIASTLGRIHPIIVTLAGISIYRGVMLEVTGGYEVFPLPDGYRALAEGELLGAPKVLWYALAVLAANWVLLHHTLPGRRLLAVGNSEKAARLIGLKPWRLRLVSFLLLGALVGLAGVLWGGYYGKVQSNTGAGWELLVIAAVVIGGCSIMGGRGTALGAFLGAVLIALIYNSLVILKISAYWQNLFVGALILGAVLVDVWLPRLRRRRKAAPS